MERVLQQSIETALESQIKQNPPIGVYRGVMLKFLGKYMSYESLKDELVQVYAAEFTGDELATLRSFYQTPVGRTAIEKLPTLMVQGMQMGQRRVQAHLGELEEMIKAESERIQALQKKNP